MTGLDRDTVFALLVLVVSSTAAWVAFGYDAESSWFPRVLSCFLIAMALVMLAGTRNSESQPLALKKHAQVALMVLAGGAAYAVALQFFSVEIVNYVFMASAMYQFGQRNPLVIVPVALATMLLIKFLFFVLLDVPRPEGVLI